ncbi:hypothetical protein CJ030_MR1G029321 [Morella rubra]|uniref:Pentacotripeptide-repeat region of PRORP domain-containing protein n=1 Tax=Morella rubra TaxID=262757 RepID=A0A6A1WTE6_9ROSI|nr:hypothetical protein CJ030_MR1G029321 [Morella rubra]
MIHSRTKAIYQTLPVVVRRFINHIRAQSYRTARPFKHKTRPRNEQRPHRPTPKPRQPIPFVINVKEAQDSDEALSLFHESLQMGFKLDYASYSALVYKFARSRNFDAVETILRLIQDRDIRCRENLFIALIQHYGKAHLVDKAIELFHRMPILNCVRTLQSLNALLNILVDGDRFADANELFGRSSKMGFRPNSITFNIMIKGWLGRDDWEQACKVFDQMLDGEVPPSVVTYNTLIGFLSRKGCLEKAMSLLEDMIQKGKYPNAVTYALLMEGLCSIGKYTEAKKMMFDMEYRGCKQRLVNYGVLMSDLGKRGKIEEAKSLVAEMRKRGFRPDVVTYNILVNYLCMEGRVAEAYKVLIEMQLGGCKPNAASYRMMLDGFCRVGDFEAGLKVLNSMLTSRHRPLSETFRCLTVGLLKCGKDDDATFVLEEMEKRDIQIDLDSWEALIRDVCCGNGGSCELLTKLVSAQNCVR